MTIEQEVRDIVAVSDDGTHLNELADEFRRGRDVSELVTLLDATDPELASLGAWIVGELPLDKYGENAEVLAGLRRLLDQPNASLRLTAFSALFPTLDPAEGSTRSLLEKLRADSHDALRSAAERASRRLFPSEDRSSRRD